MTFPLNKNVKVGNPKMSVPVTVLCKSDCFHMSNANCWSLGHAEQLLLSSVGSKVIVWHALICQKSYISNAYVDPLDNFFLISCSKLSLLLKMPIFWDLRTTLPCECTNHRAGSPCLSMVKDIRLWYLSAHLYNTDIIAVSVQRVIGQSG